MKTFTFAQINKNRDILELDYSKLADIISGKKDIAILSHTNPDGDSIGSSLSLYHFLKNAGHNATVIVPDDFPEFLAWMAGADDIIVFDKEKERAGKIISNSSVLFCLDHNSPGRLGKMEELFLKSKGVKIMIDHHVEPEERFYDIIYSTTNTSSTSELVYDMMKQTAPGLIDKTISECIYTGILTDTGSFSHSCNSEKTFRIAAELYKNGIDGVAIHRLVYNNFSEKRLRLLGYCLSEKLVVLNKYHTAYIWLTKDELERFDFKPGDTEGVVNYALGIKGIVFAALFTEKQGKVRISFRSVGDFKVNDFAKKHFQGGGHKNAAGGDSYDSMKVTLVKFEQLLEEYRKQLVK